MGPEARSARGTYRESCAEWGRTHHIGGRPMISRKTTVTTRYSA